MYNSPKILPEFESNQITFLDLWLYFLILKQTKKVKQKRKAVMFKNQYIYIYIYNYKIM